jgi:hypothetical protein
MGGQVARIGQKVHAHRVLVGKPERKKPLGRCKCRWEGNIKINVKEADWERVDWICLARACCMETVIFCIVY